MIFFLSFFVSMLYYWGVLQFIVLKLGNIYLDIFLKFAKFARKFPSKEMLSSQKLSAVMQNDEIRLIYTNYDWV